jgi:hypothetical protein
VVPLAGMCLATVAPGGSATGAMGAVLTFDIGRRLRITPWWRLLASSPAVPSLPSVVAHATSSAVLGSPPLSVLPLPVAPALSGGPLLPALRACACGCVCPARFGVPLSRFLHLGGRGAVTVPCLAASPSDCDCVHVAALASFATAPAAQSSVSVAGVICCTWRPVARHGAAVLTATAAMATQQVFIETPGSSHWDLLSGAAAFFNAPLPGFPACAVGSPQFRPPGAALTGSVVAALGARRVVLARVGGSDLLVHSQAGRSWHQVNLPAALPKLVSVVLVDTDETPPQGV